MLEVDEGDPFNKLLHAKSINSMKARNIFQDVKSEIIDTKDKNLKNINITVEEKATGEILVGAGVGSEGGTAQFSVSENNFLGKGVKLSTGLRVSEERVRGNFTITNPNFNYTEKALFTDIFVTDIDKLNDSGYESTNAGFSLGTAFEQYDDFFFRPTFRTVYEELTTNTLASANLRKQEGSYFTTEVGYTLDLDKRNQRFQTSDGFQSKFLQNIPLISESDTLLNGYQFDTYHSYNDVTASLGLYLRAVTGLSDDVRISERLKLPRKRLRGFESGKVGPVDQGDYVGGNYASALNLEAQLPNLLPEATQTDVAAFVDFGNLWSVDYDSSAGSSSKIRSSVGVTTQLYTPIGPVNFVLAQPISKAESVKTQTFKFQIGTSF